VVVSVVTRVLGGDVDSVLRDMVIQLRTDVTHVCEAESDMCEGLYGRMRCWKTISHGSFAAIYMWSGTCQHVWFHSIVFSWLDSML
jgi:hypothetical protein